MTRWSLEDLRCEVGGFRLGPVDLALPDDGALAVLGPSGAGKTTLLRAIAGVASTSSGHLRADGAPREDWAPERRGIGYVPQGLALFPHKTVRENVAFAPRLRRSEDAGIIPELIERFGLADLQSRRPASLSMGEQQRVAIARALAAAPDLLLWDEPLTALDRPAQDGLLEVFRSVRERERRPLIFVTHDASIAFSIADLALVLDAGRVESLGPIEALVARPTSPFVARFVGYENVVEREALAAARSPWTTTLLRRSGPRGVCFRAPVAVGERRAAGSWTARVLRAEPAVAGWKYSAVVDGSPVRLRSPLSMRARAGDRISFDLDESELIEIVGPVEEGG